MKTSKPLKRKRSGILVRFYPETITEINRICGNAGVPREAWIKRIVQARLEQLRQAEGAIRKVLKMPGQVPPLLAQAGVPGQMLLPVKPGRKKRRLKPAKS